MSNHFAIFLSFQTLAQDLEFTPHVTATCKAGQMNIKVQFTSPYTGAVHARDFRNPNCMSFGNGNNSVSLSLNLLAKQGSSDYCGILVSHSSGGDVSFAFCLLTY